MKTMNERQVILDTVEARKGVYQQIALDIFNHPEVSNYEFFACKTLSEQLEHEGFSIKVDVAGHRTGFTATYKGAKPGPVIVFLAEYDALAGAGSWLWPQSVRRNVVAGRRGAEAGRR